MRLTGSKYIDVFKHHKWFALTLLTIVVGVVYVATLIMPHIYRVDAEVYIVPKPLTVTGNTVVFSDSDYRMLNNQIELLKSDMVAEKAVQLIQQDKTLGKNYPISKTALQNSLSIWNKDNTSVLSINYTSSGNPKQLKAVLDHYLAAYMNTLKSINSDKASQERLFLEEQLKASEQELVEHTQNLKAFQAEHKTYSIDTQINQLLTKQSRLDEELKNINTEIASINRSIAESKQHLPSAPEHMSLLARIDQDSAITQLRQKIVDLESQRAEWSSKVTDAHPKMQTFNEEIHQLYTLLQQRLDTFSKAAQSKLSPEATSLTTGSTHDFSIANDIINNQIKLASLQAKRGVLSGAYQESNRSLNHVPETQFAYAELKVRFDSAQEKVKMLQKRLDDALLMEAVSANFTKVEIFKQPQTPKSPIRPNLQKNLSAAVLLGLCFALFAIFVRASLDKTLHWSFQLSGLSQAEHPKPVFELPPLPTRPQFKQLMEQSNFAVPEPYKKLIIHLENLNRKEQIRRIGIMPVSTFADCTMSTIMTGLYLTELSNKLILIDTDTTPYSSSRLISSLKLPVSAGIDNGLGLSDYLRGDAEDFVDIIYPLGKTVYGSLIPAGQGSQEGGFQFSHKNLGQLEANLSPNYNFVLYGLPSIERSYDSIAVGRMLDGVLLVVHPGETSLDQINQAVAEMETVGCRLLGILFQPFS